MQIQKDLLPKEILSLKKEKKAPVRQYLFGLMHDIPFLQVPILRKEFGILSTEYGINATLYLFYLLLEHHR